MQLSLNAILLPPPGCVNGFVAHYNPIPARIPDRCRRILQFLEDSGLASSFGIGSIPAADVLGVCWRMCSQDLARNRTGAGPGHHHRIAAHTPRLRLRQATNSSTGTCCATSKPELRRGCLGHRRSRPEHAPAPVHAWPTAAGCGVAATARLEVRFDVVNRGALEMRAVEAAKVEVGKRGGKGTGGTVSAGLEPASSRPAATRRGSTRRTLRVTPRRRR